MHLKNVQNTKRLIKQLEKQAAVKAKKNIVLDTQLASMQITVAERRTIYDTIGTVCKVPSTVPPPMHNDHQIIGLIGGLPPWCY